MQKQVKVVLCCAICMLIFLPLVFVSLDEASVERYNLTGSQDIKIQGGPNGRFAVEREYPAYVLTDFGEYGKQQEKIIFPVFIWTCENFKGELFCYSEEGMLILKKVTCVSDSSKKK